jgi:hypothetical protein
MAKGLFGSSLMKKFWMSITGLFLISFLVVHCALNALIFANDGGMLFNQGAHFMGTNIIIRTMEIVLFAGLIAHVVDGLMELNLLLPDSIAVWVGGQASALRRRQIKRVLVLHDLQSIEDAVNQWRLQKTKAESKANGWT